MRLHHGLSLGVLLLAGCSEPIEDPHQFGGTFTDEATQPQMDDFRVRMRAHGAEEVLLLESFPVQFSVEQIPGANCPAARDDAEGLPYVRQAGPCLPSRRS